MPRICVFDVNETLLDLSALDGDFRRIFGDASARREWFQQMLQSAFVATITNQYRDFGTIGGAALQMVAARWGVEVVAEERHQLLSGMRRLPAHEDVAESLERLRAAGLRVMALTNSTQQVAEVQLAHAGIRALFEQVFSADAVRRLKPAPEPYQMVAERLGVQTSEYWLIAAHAWDIAGALSTGCAAAFVARPGQVFDPLVARPQVVGEGLRDVVGQIIEQEKAGIR